MLISYNWLKEYVKIDINAYELADLLTAAGVIVDNVHDLNQGLAQCVVGKLLDVKKHINSDRLWICQVDVGTEVIQIVTGADNVAPGQFVPVAKVGATLPNGLKIKRSSLRGEESCGMLISLEELGYENKVMQPEEKEGIYILPDNVSEVGSELGPVLGRDDYLLELDLTPNRADCSYMTGLAYEVAALLKTEVRLPAYYCDNHLSNEVEKMVTIDIEAADLCPQYSARMFKNIKRQPAPLWMQNRLRHAGMRPISLIVDIANYVMLEHGQPLHTFDYEKIEDKHIIVRKAKAQEKIETLDRITRVLAASDLTIADPNGPIAIAGVMGGHDSEVSEHTTTMLLESASFSGPSIRRTARSLGLNSEASARFSKGIEQGRVMPALNRFAQLTKELAAGEIVPGTVSDFAASEEQAVIHFDPDHASRVAGSPITAEETIGYFERLGFSVEKSNDNLLVTIPTRRPDITSSIDLVEEVLRLRGYEKIGSTLPCVEGSGQLPLAIRNRRLVRNLLRSMGADEVVSYAFHSPEELDLLRLPENDNLRQTVKISNPLTSTQSIMRTSMLPGMLQAAKYNLNRQRNGMLIAEVGRVFLKMDDGDLPVEHEMAGILMGGLISEKNWYEQTPQQYDFYSMKGIIEAICERFHLRAEYRKVLKPYLHPGRSATVLCDQREIGYLGELHPDLVSKLGLESEIKMIFAELNLNVINELSQEDTNYREIAPYPAVARDLAIVINEEYPVGDMLNVIQKTAGELLEDIKIFDIYQGVQLQTGQKSCAFNLKYRAGDRTLKAEEVNAVHNQVIDALIKHFNAALR